MIKLLVTALFVTQMSLYAALSAVGYGSTQKEAKEGALSALSGQVSSKVKSSLKTSTTLKAGKATIAAQKDLNIDTNSYFQGVRYSKAVKSGSGYQVTASLDNKGITNTLTFLQKELHKNLAALSRRALKVLLKQAEMAYALANFSPNKRSIQADVKTQELEVQKYLSYAQITFNIKPNTATILVNDQPYELYKTYLLPASTTYRFEIKADGFYTETGRLTFGIGEKRTVVKQLIKKSEDTARVYVDVKSDVTEFKDTASGLLLNYGVAISPTSTATNAIRFTFNKRLVTTVEDMKVYNVMVKMTVFKGTETIMIKKITRKNIVDGNYIKKVDAAVKALTKYLLKKQDMKAFIGNESINYDDI